MTVWAGDYFLREGVEQNAPPPDSWAKAEDNDVAVLHITLQPGAKLVLPKANSPEVNRSVYLIEGFDGANIDGTSVTKRVVVDVDGSKDVALELPESATEASEFLLLQGKPIDEPVVQHGPFVMNDRKEIMEAFQDYSRTKFGGWPWPRDDMVFPRDKGRFALVDGKESTPNEKRGEL